MPARLRGAAGQQFAQRSHRLSGRSTLQRDERRRCELNLPEFQFPLAKKPLEPARSRPRVPPPVLLSYQHEQVERIFEAEPAERQIAAPREDTRRTQAGRESYAARWLDSGVLSNAM